MGMALVRGYAMARHRPALLIFDIQMIRLNNLWKPDIPLNNRSLLIMLPTFVELAAFHGQP